MSETAFRGAGNGISCPLLCRFAGCILVAWLSLFCSILCHLLQHFVFHQDALQMTVDR
jgi:tellurite resistance protein TehA-like permease